MVGVTASPSQPPNAFLVAAAGTFEVVVGAGLL